MQITKADGCRIDHELSCPVPSCVKSFDSVPGVMGHVGSSHEDGWAKATQTPREVKQEATAADTQASKAVARVMAYLCRHGVSTDSVAVYYDHSYQKVQIETENLGDEWPAFKRATDTDGIRYAGGNRSYCTNVFVEDLPEVPSVGGCAIPGCRRNGPRVAPVIDTDGDARVLCPYHRKEHWGVSS